jgi:hypothetical protein
MATPFFTDKAGVNTKVQICLEVPLASLILSRSICTLAQFAYLRVEPKTDDA